MKQYFIYSVTIILLFTSCSGYEKLLKSTDYNLKYKKALEYYNQKEYVKSGNLFEQIQSFYRGTEKADTVDFLYAKSLYGQGDYILSGEYFKNFGESYQYSDFAEEANFLCAYCFYLTSPRPSLDQENTYNAIQAFQLFLIKYPNSSRKKDCLGLIAELKDKLVEKSFISAKLYFDLGEYKSSIIALNNSLNEYPDTKYREEMMFLVLKSKYLLATYSIPEKQKERYQNSVDEYYSFIAEFPKSTYIKEAEKMYDTSTKELKN